VEARNSLVAAARELGRPASELKVAVRPLARFWPAETYHQNYARRHGLQYRYYRWSCGRDRRLDAVWGARARTGDRWLGSPAATPAAAATPAPAGRTAAGPTAAAPVPAAPTATAPAATGPAAAAAKL
jgi:hypothetical protein